MPRHRVEAPEGHYPGAVPPARSGTMGKLNEDAMKEAAQHSRCIIAVVTGPERDGDSEENAYFKRQYCMNELRWARVRAAIFLCHISLVSPMLT